MTLHRFFALRYISTAVLVTASLYLQAANATGLDSLSRVMAPGSTAVISIDPVLPKKGEPFTINITGQWRDRCIPDQSEVTYTVFGSQRGSIRIVTVLDRTNACGIGFEPTTYKLSVPVASSDWETVRIVLDVRDALNGRGHMYWSREFDLIFGLHDIPPRLGSGNWISEDAPFQGLVVQQQGSTVVFYELTYNRTSGEPNWHYADGKFYGNALNGVAYLVNWLAPVDGVRRGLISAPGSNPSEIPVNRLVQPQTQELAFAASSAGIYVLGVNRIKAFVGLYDGGPPSLEEGLYPASHTYKRWIFGRDDVQLAAFVPDMTGPWNLYGFNGQKLEQAYQLEFRAGSKVGDNLYRFSSLDNAWVMDCQVNRDGEGACTLINDGLGLTLNYSLDTASFDSSHFNGNFAKAPLISSNSAEPDQTGILLRAGLHLPVLDLQ